MRFVAAYSYQPLVLTRRLPSSQCHRCSRFPLLRQTRVLLKRLQCTHAALLPDIYLLKVPQISNYLSHPSSTPDAESELDAVAEEHDLKRETQPQPTKTIPPGVRLEEETLPTYDVMRFYPAAEVGKVLGDKYELVCKLGYGEHWTEWLAKDLDLIRYAHLSTLMLLLCSPSLWWYSGQKRKQFRLTFLCVCIVCGEASRASPRSLA